MYMASQLREYFKDLKKTMKGKNNYFFLVNDSNNEILQHYDDGYESKFNSGKFKASQKAKMSYLRDNNINYKMFVVPDKSVILRKYLPFDTDTPKRHIDSLHDFAYDALEVVNENDYQVNDTHINMLACVKVVSFILSKMDKSKNILDHARDLWDKLHIEISDDVKGDLFQDLNWSYPKDALYKKYSRVTFPVVVTNDECTQVDDIPEEFATFGSRQSIHVVNPNSISDKKALLLHDSSTLHMMPAFNTYYREVFYYWDHWYFSKDLIKYFNPDDVIEVRTERFIDNALCPVFDDDTNVLIPVEVSFEKFMVNDDKLEVDISAVDLCKVKASSDFECLVDEARVYDAKLEDGRASFTIGLDGIGEGSHEFNLILKENERNSARNIKKTFEVKI